MTLEKHVWCRAVALGLPNRQVLIRKGRAGAGAQAGQEHL